MEEELNEQTNNRPWLYKKGQSGNPKGRPPGTFSLKEYVKKKLASMSDEEREEYLEGLDKKTIWEMGEGKALTTSEGKIELNVPQPINYVQRHDSISEDKQAE
jgi:hypothetical protein